MVATVGIVEFDGDNITRSLNHVLDLIGGIAHLNTAERSVVVKVGVFSHKAENHASVDVVGAVADCFNRAPKILLAESDNYQGTGLEGLQIWKGLFTERIVPFNLSNDHVNQKMKFAGQDVSLPHTLFKPNVLVDAHILRSFKSGSILKNLFGCILDTKRVKYHKVLPVLLADVYEAIGGIDLAVLDGTYFWRGAGGSPIRMNTLLVGRDAVAVETVGAALVGLDPQRMPVIHEFAKRGLSARARRTVLLDRIEQVEIEEELHRWQSTARVRPCAETSVSQLCFAQMTLLPYPCAE